MCLCMSMSMCMCMWGGCVEGRGGGGGNTRHAGRRRANTATHYPPTPPPPLPPEERLPPHAALPPHTHLVGVGELLLGRRAGRPGGVPDVVGADEVLEPAGGRRVGLGGLRYLSPLGARRPLALYPQRGGLGGRRVGGGRGLRGLRGLRGGDLPAPSALGLLGGRGGGGGAGKWYGCVWERVTGKG